MFVEPLLAPWRAHPYIFACWTLVILVVSRALFNRYGRGIAHIPGPFLASCTDLWRVFVVWGRRPELEHIRLHERHGPLVRLGPRAVSVSDPAAIQIIYALNSGFVKSEFYPVQQTIARGRRLFTMFTSTDEKFHAKLRRAVSNAYAMSTLVQFEPLVDSTTREFLNQLEERFANKAGADGICDFSKWLQYYAFDVIGKPSVLEADLTAEHNDQSVALATAWPSHETTYRNTSFWLLLTGLVQAN